VQDTDYLSAEGNEKRKEAVRGNATMRKEYDFSRGERGKFFRPDVQLNIPIYLEPQVAQAVRELARRRHTTMGSLVNERLRKSLRAARQGR
jgi:hypothetical protein